MHDSKTLIIIQARMGSNRFPGKVLAKFNNKPIIKYLIELAKSLPFEFVVATPDTEDNQPLWDYLSLEVCDIFKGHPTDVLDRFYQCASSYQADTIIRLCADTPLVTKTDFWLQFNYFEQTEHFTYGNGVYVMSMGELRSAWVNAKAPEHREHVTPYMIKSIDYAEDLERWEKAS